MRPAAAAVVMCAMMLGAGAAEAQGLRYGVKGGVTLADLHSDNSASSTSGTPYDFRIGFVAGGFVTKSVGGRLALQPEVLFTQKGARAEQGGGKLTQKLDYLDIPVLISYRLTGTTERHISLFGGPAVGLRVRARSSASFGGDTLEENIDEQVKSTDLAVVGGVAYHRGRFVADGRYAWGLTDIDKDTGDTLKVKTRGISFLAGWTF